MCSITWLRGRYVVGMGGRSVEFRWPAEVTSNAYWGGVVFLFPQENPGAGRGAPGGEFVAAGSPGGAGRKPQGAATVCAGRRYK